MSDLFLSNQKNPFVGFPTDWICRYVKTVELLLYQNSKLYVAPTLKNGKKAKFYPMPWMLPAWQKG
jgi:hypothetical protein